MNLIQTLQSKSRGKMEKRRTQQQKKRLALFAVFAMALLVALFSGGAPGAKLWAKGNNKANSNKKTGQIVNVYSSRHYDIDMEIYNDFAQKTGIRVNLVAGNAGEMIEKAMVEGENTQADIFYATGADVLYQLKSQGLLGEIPQRLRKLVPQHLADSDGNWIAVSKRARVIVYDKTRMSAPGVSSYEELVQSGKKIAIRTSANSYNRMLLASIIQAGGEDGARQWVRDLVRNLARPPQGNDRSQAKAVVAGLADYAIVNSYYVGLMLRNPKEASVAESLGIIHPNQGGRGAHVNISGVGISKYAKNRDSALALIEFMLASETQKRLVDENSEYPANASIPLNDLLSSWGDFAEDSGDLNQIASHVPLAAKIADEEGWQ